VVLGSLGHPELGGGVLPLKLGVRRHCLLTTRMCYHCKQKNALFTVAYASTNGGVRSTTGMDLKSGELAVFGQSAGLSFKLAKMWLR
jgi:hypothetical protein